MGSVNTCLCLQSLVLGNWELGQSGALKGYLWLCVFEPVVLGLDKRKTAFSEVDFTQPPQVDKGLQPFLCLHINTCALKKMLRLSVKSKKMF